MNASQLRTRIAELRRRDRRRQLFGAASHGYALGPPVDLVLLDEIERTLGQRLPEAYRQFLCELGEGGAGPYHGVLSLAASIACAHGLQPVPPDQPQGQDRPPPEPRELVTRLPAFTRDFPLLADVDFGELIGRPASWDEHVRRLESDPGYADRWEELRARYLSPPYDGGILPFCEYGCGDFFVIVLRGARRGTVWTHGVLGGTGLYCLEVGFDEFYRRWLEDALARAGRDLDLESAHYEFLRYGDNPRYRPA